MKLLFTETEFTVKLTRGELEYITSFTRSYTGNTATSSEEDPEKRELRLGLFTEAAKLLRDNP